MNKPIIINSSKQQKSLKKRSFIISSIKQFFLQDSLAYHFFYTGHGTKNGDLSVETQENQQGENISIAEIIQIWRSIHGITKSKYLYIYLDSCYSGTNAVKCQNIFNKNQRIYLYCSSGDGYPSRDCKYYGGLLICLTWIRYNNPKSLSQNTLKELKLKFQDQKPVCILSTEGLIKDLDWS